MWPSTRKQGLCAQNIPVHILVCRYLHFYKSYWRSVSFVRFSMLFCLRGKIFNWKVHLHKELLTFKTWKIGQILCAHKVISCSELSHARKKFLLDLYKWWLKITQTATEIFLNKEFFSHPSAEGHLMHSYPTLYLLSIYTFLNSEGFLYKLYYWL